MNTLGVFENGDPKGGASFFEKTDYEGMVSQYTFVALCYGKSAYARYLKNYNWPDMT